MYIDNREDFLMCYKIKLAGIKYSTEEDAKNIFGLKRKKRRSQRERKKMRRREIRRERKVGIAKKTEKENT